MQIGWKAPWMLRQNQKLHKMHEKAWMEGIKKMGLIDADAFFNDFPELKNYEHASQEYEVDAEPVKRGHWIRNDNGTYSCSECKSWIPNEQHYYARYCLFCGARMEEVNK